MVRSGGGAEVARNLEAEMGRRTAAIYALLDNWGKQLEGQAKTKAPWTDRTGHARQGLHGGVFQEGPDLVLFLSHSVEYGIWLELAHAGRYAVLKPTMEVNYPQIVATVKKLWE